MKPSHSWPVSKVMGDCAVSTCSWRLFAQFQSEVECRTNARYWESGRRAMILRLNEGAHLSDVTLPELRNHFGLARGSDVLCLLTAGFVRGFDIIRYLMVFRAPRRTISRTCSNISKFQCVLTSTEVSGRRHTCHTAKSKAFTCTP